MCIRDRMIAALRDLYVSGVARGGEDALSEIVIQVRRGREIFWSDTFAKSGYFFEFVRAYNRVDIGNVFLNVVAEALDQTAGDDQPLSLAGSLILGHLKNGVDGFLLRWI